MTLREKLVYGAVVWVVALVASQFVFRVGSFRLSLLIAVCVTILAVMAASAITRARRQRQ